MDLVIGVDAGGTATRAVVSTLDGQILGQARAGPGNPLAVGAAAAAAQIISSVRAALSQSAPADEVFTDVLPGSADPGRYEFAVARRVRAAVVGVAGFSALTEPATAEAFANAWTDVGVEAPVTYHGDAVVAFAAGTPARDGAVLIAGTGAVAATVHDGRITRVADGLGWLLGDEGSGFWLGVRAVRQVARRWVGTPDRAPTGLTAAVARHAQVSDVDSLIRWATGSARTDVAALATVVCAAADRGDPEAQAIVADAVRRLLASLDELGSPPDIPVVLAGGVLAHDTPVRAGVLEALQARGTPVGTAWDPALGATWMAARDGLDHAAAAHLHAVLCPQFSAVGGAAGLG